MIPLLVLVFYGPIHPGLWIYTHRLLPGFFVLILSQRLELENSYTRIYEQTAVKLSIKIKALLPCLLMQNSNFPPWAHWLEALLAHSQPMLRSFLPKDPQTSVQLCQYIFYFGLQITPILDFSGVQHL